MAASVMMWIACLVFATEASPCKDNQHCSDCDRESGDCLTDCDTGYYDRHCNSTCSKNCRNNKCVTSSYGSANCTDGCVPGYQGASSNIPCDSPGGTCTACPGGCDGGYCQLKKINHCSDCDGMSGDCLTECDTGYYGRKCNSTCSKNCRNNTCVTSSHGSANCAEGCVPGYHGRGCNIPCDSPGGTCTACPGGCDGGYCQLGSSCVSGCVDSYYGTDCDGATVGVSGAAISFLVMVFLVVCCKYRQRFRQKSVTQTEDVVCDSVDDMGGEPVVELEWYSETPLKDMATPCGSPDGNCGSGGAAGGGADDVYDVADVGRRELAAVFDNIYSKISRA